MKYVFIVFFHHESSTILHLFHTILIKKIKNIHIYKIFFFLPGIRLSVENRNVAYVCCHYQKS